MRLKTPRSMSSIPRLVVIPLFFIACGLFFLPRHYGSPTRLHLHIPIIAGKNVTETSSTFNGDYRQFWAELATALLESQPQCKPLELDGNPMGLMIHFQPLQTHKNHPARIVGFTERDEIALFRAHYTMRRAAQHLAPKLPFSKGKTGIVTTANAQCKRLRCTNCL
jgi:alpha 1,2-mannosyltransferase